MTGLCGIVLKAESELESCAELLFYGTDYHSHLGTEIGGMVVWGDDKPNKEIHSIRHESFQAQFEKELERMCGRVGIGVISDKDIQPLFAAQLIGNYFIAFSGIMTNKDELRDWLIRTGAAFTEFTNSETNEVEIFSKLMAEGRDIPDGIVKAREKIHGSGAVLVLTKEGIYAANDAFSRTILGIGESKNAYAVVSQDFSLQNLDSTLESIGFNMIKELGPGEIIFISKDGLEQKVEANEENLQHCSFNPSYTSFPAASTFGMSAERFRNRLGEIRAKKDYVIKELIDELRGKGLSYEEIREKVVTTGIPDSGTGHAVGYCNVSFDAFGVPLKRVRVFVKFSQSYGRSFTPLNQEVRDRVAKYKLVAIPDIVKGKIIIINDDSLVRGTQLINQIKKLKSLGAEQVHVRFGYPPLRYACEWLRSTRTQEEVIFARAVWQLEGKQIEDMGEYFNSESEKYKAARNLIAEWLGADSVMYPTVNDWVEASGMPREKFCFGCTIR